MIIFRGSEFLVSTTTTSNYCDSSFAVLADGRFVMSWTDFSQSGSDTNVLATPACLFSADGLDREGGTLSTVSYDNAATGVPIGHCFAQLPKAPTISKLGFVVL